MPTGLGSRLTFSCSHPRARQSLRTASEPLARPRRAGRLPDEHLTQTVVVSVLVRLLLPRCYCVATALLPDARQRTAQKGHSCVKVEATSGFEPLHRGFAVRRTGSAGVR